MDDLARCVGECPSPLFGAELRVVLGVPREAMGTMQEMPPLASFVMKIGR